jgi:hypothetical protein
MKTSKRFGIVLISLCIFGIIIAAVKVFADPPPVLTIANLGTNQYSITITNGISTANYELYWTPILANPDYPFTLAIVGTEGQTNFVVNMGIYQTGFFQVILGTDWDGDGVPNWQDANPSDPTIGILTVVIDSPTNGMVLQ